MAKKHNYAQNTQSIPEATKPQVASPVKEQTPIKQYYRICTQRNEHLLAKEIELLLSEGWSLEGGATVSATADSYGITTIFCQAVTKQYV